MNIRTCRHCGKMYTFIRSPFCGDCLEIIDQQYQLVRDYLEDHPKAPIAEVTRETGVSERIVLHLLREGRLSFETQILHCERCKVQIDSGRFCPRCLSILQNGLNEVQKAGQTMQDAGTASQNASARSQQRRTTAAGASAEPDHGMHIDRKKR